MEIWETIAKNDAVINMLNKSEEDREESRRLEFESKNLERKAYETVLESKGITIGKTVVRNKETGTLGVLHLETGFTTGMMRYYGVAFYPLKKNGEQSSKQSYNDRPSYALNLNHNYREDCWYDQNGMKVTEAEAKALFLEGLTDQLEVTELETK